MKLELDKKNVIITGATGGIGSKIVEDMSNLGANLIISGTNESKLIELADSPKKILFM